MPYRKRVNRLKRKKYSTSLATVPGSTRNALQEVFDALLLSTKSPQAVGFELHDLHMAGNLPCPIQVITVIDHTNRCAIIILNVSDRAHTVSTEYLEVSKFRMEPVLLCEPLKSTEVNQEFELQKFEISGRAESMPAFGTDVKSAIVLEVDKDDLEANKLREGFATAFYRLNVDGRAHTVQSAVCLVRQPLESVFVRSGI